MIYDTPGAALGFISEAEFSVCGVLSLSLIAVYGIACATRKKSERVQYSTVQNGVFLKCILLLSAKCKSLSSCVAGLLLGKQVKEQAGEQLSSQCYCTVYQSCFFFLLLPCCRVSRGLSL